MQSYPTEAIKNIYTLLITESSKYCGIETWKWEYHTSFLDRSITHVSGIYHFTENRIAQGLSFIPEIAPAITSELSTKIWKSHLDLNKDDDRDERLGASASRGPSARTDKKVSWFERYLGFIASVTGAAVGISAAAASFSCCWFNAGGFFVKGPLGLHFSGSYFSGGFFGVACLAAGTGLAAGALASAAVYHIPWGTVLDFVKRVLGGIWDKIKEYAVCIWAKLKTLVDDVASALRQGISGNAFPYMAKPPRLDN